MGQIIQMQDPARLQMPTLRRLLIARTKSLKREKLLAWELRELRKSLREIESLLVAVGDEG